MISSGTLDGTGADEFVGVVGACGCGASGNELETPDSARNSALCATHNRFVVRKRDVVRQTYADSILGATSIGRFTAAERKRILQPLKRGYHSRTSLSPIDEAPIDASLGTHSGEFKVQRVMFFATLRKSTICRARVNDRHPRARYRWIIPAVAYPLIAFD